jgi:hypothetical protein
MYGGVSLLTALIVLAFAFSLGYARAVWVRARADYKRTKAAVPGLRKDAWRAVWATMRIGTGVAILYLLITAWAIHDVGAGEPQPAASTAPSPGSHVAPARSHR